MFQVDPAPWGTRSCQGSFPREMYWFHALIHPSCSEDSLGPFLRSECIAPFRPWVATSTTQRESTTHSGIDCLIHDDIAHAPSTRSARLYPSARTARGALQACPDNPAITHSNNTDTIPKYTKQLECMNHPPHSK